MSECPEVDTKPQPALELRGMFNDSYPALVPFPRVTSATYEADAGTVTDLSSSDQLRGQCVKLIPSWQGEAMVPMADPMAVVHRTILARSSSGRAGDGRIDFDVFRHSAKDLGVDDQKPAESGGQALEEPRKLVGEGQTMDGDGLVESRTPPAMERNLFLSALANGKIAVSAGRR